MLETSLEAPGLNDLRLRFANSAAIVGPELRTALERSLSLTRREIQQRTPVKTGALRRSIRVRTEGGGALVRGLVWSDAPYATFVEKGTRPHRIEPKAGQALRWFSGGRPVFAKYVNHPGTRGQHFMRDGFNAAQPGIEREFRGALRRVVLHLARRG